MTFKIRLLTTPSPFVSRLCFEKQKVIFLYTKLSSSISQIYPASRRTSRPLPCPYYPQQWMPTLLLSSFPSQARKAVSTHPLEPPCPQIPTSPSRFHLLRRTQPSLRTRCNHAPPKRERAERARGRGGEGCTHWRLMLGDVTDLVFALPLDAEMHLDLDWPVLLTLPPSLTPSTFFSPPRPPLHV